MEKFVELKVNGECCIVNVNAIQTVRPIQNEGCLITFTNGEQGIRTEMTYKELSKILLGK